MIINILLLIFFGFVHGNYYEERQNMLNDELNQMIGHDIQLNSKELKFNKLLKRIKQQDLAKGFENPGQFLPSHHFFDAKDEIKRSALFKIINKMPKGAATFVYDIGMASFDVFWQLTYKPDIHCCLTFEDGLPDKLLYLVYKPEIKKDVQCVLLKDSRKEYSGFDSWLTPQLTLVVANPRENYPNSKMIWKKYSEVEKKLAKFLSPPIFYEEYMIAALQEFADDGVNFIEVRSHLSHLENNGTPMSLEEHVVILKNISEKFKKTRKGFDGIKLIYVPRAESMRLDEFKSAQLKYSDFLIGIDPAGLEMNSMVIAKSIRFAGDNTAFYLTAGNTNWNGQNTDLIDAILLNTTRIAHGYQIPNHPKVMEDILTKGIAVEVCPISNQAFQQVVDIRNHPATMLMSLGFPIIISSYRPGFLDTKGLSFDLYMAFLGMTHVKADLKTLKKLVMNSLIFSSLNETEKLASTTEWNKQWQKFLTDFVP